MGHKLTGSDLRAQATRLGKEYNLADFKASNGWLYKFKNRFISRRGYDFREDSPEPGRYPPPPIQQMRIIPLSSTASSTLSKPPPSLPVVPTLPIPVPAYHHHHPHHTFPEPQDFPEPSYNLNDMNPNQNEIGSALTTIKFALEARYMVPKKFWDAFDDIEEFLTNCDRSWKRAPVPRNNSDVQNNFIKNHLCQSNQK